MIRLLCAFIVFAAAPVVARSDTSTDQLYTLIQAQDIQGIGAMLAQASKDDLSKPGEFPAQRALFDVFQNSNPSVDQVTQAWVKQSPDDPNALVARSNYLFAMGWNYRGETAAYLVPDENMRMMKQLHQDAFQLAKRAVSLAPDLAAASDALILAVRTINGRDKGFIEFQRFMALHPNRRTLMRQALILAPQWGAA